MAHNDSLLPCFYYLFSSLRGFFFFYTKISLLPSLNFARLCERLPQRFSVQGFVTFSSFFFVLHLIFMQKLSWYSNNPQAQEFLLAYTFCPGLSYFFLLVFTEKTLRGSIMWSDQRYREVGMRRCHFVVLQRMPDCCHFFFPLSTFNRYSLCGNNTRCFLERV